MLNQTITDSWKFFIRHWKTLFLIYLPMFIVYAIDYIIDSSVTQVVYLFWLVAFYLLLLATSVMVHGFSIYYIVASISNTKAEWPIIYQLVKRKYLSLLILIVAIYIVTIFGLALLIIPGLFFLIKMAFASFEMLLNNASPAVSVERSWHQTRGYFSILLGGMFIITVPAYAFYYSLHLSLPRSEMFNLLVYGVGILADFLVSTLMTIFCFRIYDLYKADLRAAQEDSGLTNINAD